MNLHGGIWVFCLAISPELSPLLAGASVNYLLHRLIGNGEHTYQWVIFWNIYTWGQRSFQASKKEANETGQAGSARITSYCHMIGADSAPPVVDCWNLSWPLPCIDRNVPIIQEVGRNRKLTPTWLQFENTTKVKANFIFSSILFLLYSRVSTSLVQGAVAAVSG